MGPLEIAIGSAGATAIGTLFTLLIRSQDQRAKEALERAAAAEKDCDETQGRLDEAVKKTLEVSQDCSEKLSRANAELAKVTAALLEITKGLTERRPSISGRS